MNFPVPTGKEEPRFTYDNNAVHYYIQIPEIVFPGMDSGR